MKKLALAILATTLFSTPAFADHSQVNVQVNPVGTYAWENGRLVKYNHRYRPAPVVITIRDHRNQYVHMVPIRNQYNPHYNTYVPRHHHRRNNDAEKVIKGVIAGALIYDIVKD